MVLSLGRKTWTNYKVLSLLYDPTLWKIDDAELVSMSTGCCLLLDSLSSELSQPQPLTLSQLPVNLGQFSVFAPQNGATMGGRGSAFAPAPRAASTHRIGVNTFVFHGVVNQGQNRVISQPEQTTLSPVLGFPAPVAPSPEQLKEREQHKKAFFELYAAQHCNSEPKKTKLIQKSVYTEAVNVLKVLRSGRHPSEAEVNPDASEAFSRKEDQGFALHPLWQPRKRPRKMPRRFYHYVRVYTIHNYEGNLALAYRPDTAEGGDLDRAGKPPRLVTCYEVAFRANSVAVLCLALRLTPGVCF